MDLSEVIVLGLESIGFMVLVFTYVALCYLMERLKSRRRP